jgi:hypothetical protein
VVAVDVRGHPIEPFRENEESPNSAGMIGFALAMLGEDFHSGRCVNADLF